MTRISFRHAFDPIEVEWDETHVFATIDLPRSKARHAAEAIAGLAKAKDDDELVKAYGVYFDRILTPVEGRKKLSTLIREAWEAEELTVEQIDSFMDRMAVARRQKRQEAAAEVLNDRPT